ncbi:MAG: hypothetical protein U1E65_12585 [Myxococcota bacterium]
MNRCAAMCVTLSLSLGGAACSGSAGLQLDLAVETDVAPLIVQYEARFFRSLTCPEMELVGGHPDVARTATTSLFVTSPTIDFKPIEISGFAGELAIDIRGVDATGIPMARRCTSVLPSTAGAGVILSRFVPTGSSFSILDPVTLTAGTASTAALVKVVDSAGMPVENAFVSVGKSAVLSATDHQGLARVHTPSEPANFSGALEARIYGITSAPQTINAETVPSPHCPEVLWSRDLVPGVVGAETEIEVGVRGGLSLIAVLRPTSAVATTNSIELLRLDADSGAARTVATATTAATGPIAVLPTADGNAWIGLGRTNGDLEILRFDGAGGTLTSTRTLSTHRVAGGRIRRLSAAEDLLVVVGDVPSGVAAFADWKEPAAQPVGDQSDAIDARLFGPVTAHTLIVSTSTALAAYVQAGNFSPLGAPLRGVAGTIFGDDLGALAILDATDNRRVHAVGLMSGPAPLVSLGRSSAASALSSVALGDLNGDHHPDLLATDAMERGAPLLVGGQFHRFLEVDRCSDALDLVRTIAPGGGVRPRWIGRIVTTGKIALLEVRG